jgi:hypothetical protein
MSKRFSSTEKWQDLWYQELPPDTKLLFIYLCDNCDIAGFWEINLPMASFMTKIKDDIEGAFKGLARCYVQNDKYIWLKNFLYHQKNLPLNPDNQCHKGILRIINSHGSFGESVLKELEIQIVEKGLQSPSGIGKGKGSGKGNIVYTVEFEKFWTVYPRKIGKGKAWESWLRINPPLELQFKMYDAIRLQTLSAQWQKDGGQFIPHPSTWINQRRWEDTPEINVPAPKQKLPIIVGKTCTISKCGLPAVYKSTGGTYDSYYCVNHLPEKVKAIYG